MEIFILFSILICLAAVFSYLNVRVIKFPLGIGMMLMGTLSAIALVLLGFILPNFVDYTRSKLELIDFSQFVLQFMLSFLLFAGSLHAKVSDLKDSVKSIAAFSLVGTLVSTALIGCAVYFIAPLYPMPPQFVNFQIAEN